MQQTKVASPIVKRESKWKTFANALLAIVLIGIVAWQCEKNWSAISGHVWHPQWGLATAALAILLLNTLLEIVIWNMTVGWFIDPFPFRLAAPIYIWSSLARYIPGKVMSLLLRAAMATEVGSNAVPVLAASTVELALRIASASLFFLVTLLGWGIAAGRGILLTVAAVIPLVLICAHPAIMMPVLNWGLRKIKQPPLAHRLRYRDVLGIFLAHTVRLAVFGLGFAMLGCALLPAALPHLPILVGSATGAWVAGFISMSPGGVGVQELVQKLILQNTLHFPAEVALVLSVLFRFLTLIAEGIWAFICIFLWRSMRGKAHRETGPESSN